MLYLATASTPMIRDAMRSGALGLMAQPGSNGPSSAPGVPWAADNGCFAAKWNQGRWAAWLAAQADHLRSCLFAVVPDVVADAPATRARFEVWAPMVAALGYRLAYVLQDGADDLPWDDFEVLFVGGSTAYKESLDAAAWVGEARARGKGTHMGRVNSLRRMRLAVREGYDSADGTFLAFGPDINLPRLTRMVRRAHEPSLFGIGVPPGVGIPRYAYPRLPPNERKEAP